MVAATKLFCILAILDRIIHDISGWLSYFSEVVYFELMVGENNRVVNELNGILFLGRFNVVVEFVEFFTEISQFLYCLKTLKMSVLSDLILKSHISQIVILLIVFVQFLTVEVLCYIVKIVLSTLR